MIDVGPEEAAQGLAPAVGLAEEVEHLLLLSRSITAARDLNLDLAAQGDGVDGLVGYTVFDLELECQHGNCGEGNNARGVDQEAEVRHSRLRGQLRIWTATVGRIGRPLSRLLRRRRGLSSWRE